MPLRTGCSAGYPATGGTRTRFELTAGTRWSSIWAPPTGCWWWTRPASSRRGARRGASRWGCRGSTAAPRGGSKIPQGEYSWPTLAPGAGPGWTGSCSCLRYGWRTGSDAVPPGCRSMSNSAPSRSWPSGCWSGRWDREFPAAGLLETRSTAATATGGGGWRRRASPRCWPSRATSSCGPGPKRGPAKCGPIVWRRGLTKRAGSGCARGTAPRVPDFMTGPPWR